MDFQTAGTVGSDGWNYCRSAGVSGVVPISKSFPWVILTEPLQSSPTSDRRTAGLRAEVRGRSAKGQLEAVVQRMSVFVTHDFNESWAGTVGHLRLTVARFPL